MHDSGVPLGKGNVDHFLSAEQAHQLFENLASCAYSLETRSWRIWGKVIEWRAESAMELRDRTIEEIAVFEYLNHRGRISERKREIKTR